MKILENVPVKSIFHDGKSNRMKIYICISGFFLLRGNGGGVPTHRPKICSFFVQLCSSRNQCICFQVILFLFISNSQYIAR